MDFLVWLTSWGNYLGFCAEIIGKDTTISLEVWSHWPEGGNQSFVFETHESLDVQDVDFLHSYLVTSSDLNLYFKPDEKLTVSYTEYGTSGIYVPDVILDAHPRPGTYNLSAVFNWACLLFMYKASKETQILTIFSFLIIKVKFFHKIIDC